MASMKQRKPPPPRNLRLFVRPARPSPAWPRDVVGDLKWAGVQRGGFGWYYDLPGDTLARREVGEAMFAVRGALPWAVFRVLRAKQ
jgi:hypothetical protein